ncbi:OsmC family protein [Desertivirga xinjiangensis]|uniref:OsmC family protein n=1 Tax=Desertivirga xinjiangensis TaxID=539206 RepID=UPI00210C6D3D|nr:OsmC family protein [Pedobacter xinjiangensis]
MIRRSTAVWNGTGKEGKGVLTSTSGVLSNTPYSFAARFESEDGKAGTNPEELIAAAHAGCFSMALSFQLAGAGFTPDELKTEAAVKVEPGEGGFSITSITLKLEAKIPGISEEQFSELANAAKAGCPVSKALSAVDITLAARLV